LGARGLKIPKRNPVEAIGLCQIAKVFAGKIRDWRELGGRSGPINVMSAPAHRAPSGRSRAW